MTRVVTISIARDPFLDPNPIVVYISQKFLTLQDAAGFSYELAQRAEDLRESGAWEPKEGDDDNS